MKNASKRTKIILAIIGVLVVVVVAIGIFVQVGGNGLFGSSYFQNGDITPNHPYIAVGQTVKLTVDANFACTWTPEPRWGNVDEPYISLMDYYYTRPDGTSYHLETKTVTVKGERPGTASITAHCGFGILNVNSYTAHVTVVP